MRYRNKKTGAEIETLGIIAGEDWEELPSSRPVAEKPKEEAKKPVEKRAKSTKTKTSRK